MAILFEERFRFCGVFLYSREVRINGREILHGRIVLVDVDWAAEAGLCDKSKVDDSEQARDKHQCAQPLFHRVEAATLEVMVNDIECFFDIV